MVGRQSSVGVRIVRQNMPVLELGWGVLTAVLRWPFLLLPVTHSTVSLDAKL